jgi:hypothetical protein
MPAILDVVEHGPEHVDAVAIQGHLKALVDELEDDHVRSPLSYCLDTRQQMVACAGNGRASGSVGWAAAAMRPFVD